MHPIFLVPSWFVGYDIAFELIFAVITLLVALKAYQVYKLSSENHIKLFANAFTLISISYFIQAIMNIFIVTELNETIDRAVDFLTINDINNIALFIHIAFFLFALVTLVYMTFNIRSVTAYSFIAAIIAILLIVNPDFLYTSYLISAILLFYIFVHYFINFIKHKRLQTFIVMVAFLLLLFGSIHFTLSVEHGLYYVIGHFLGLVAYALILINLMLVGAHGKKKGSPANNS